MNGGTPGSKEGSQRQPSVVTYFKCNRYMNGSQVVVVVVVVVSVAAAGVELLLLSLTHGQRETPAQAYYNNAIALVCLY